MADPCPFCAGPLAGNHSTDIVERWADTIAIVPLDPVTRGHTIVIPHAHVEDALTDPAVTGLVHQRAAELADSLLCGTRWVDGFGLTVIVQDPGWDDAEGVNLITSVGAAATATVRHLHVHLVPRRAGDGLALPWTGQVVSRG